MNRKILISVIIVSILIVIMRLTSPSKYTGPEKVEDVVWRMFSAAKKGDIDTYLACFTGPSLVNLNAVRQEKTDSGFRDYIRQNSQEVKAISITNGKDGENGTRVFDVEIVYADRNELQAVSLQKVDTGWKISNMLRPMLTSQPIPYMKQVVE